MNSRIIVPIYKVESYLDSCIQSILKQSYHKVEVILVDDGSPDNCGEICDRYAQGDDRIVVIHQKNQGVTAVRYAGYKQSSGEFLLFVDGDDTLPEQAVETFINSIEDDIDIIIGNIVGDGEDSYIDPEVYIRCCILGYLVPSSIWARLFRRTIFKDEVFNIPRDVKIGEDMLVNIRLAFLNQKRVKTISSVVYNYTCNINGAIHQRVWSLDYEQYFHEIKISSMSVTSQEKYAWELIVPRMFALINFLNSPDKEKSSWQNHPFVLNLKSDIKRKGLLIERMIITTSNARERRFLIKVYGYIKRFLLYFKFKCRLKRKC